MSPHLNIDGPGNIRPKRSHAKCAASSFSLSSRSPSSLKPPKSPDSSTIPQACQSRTQPSPFKIRQPAQPGECPQTTRACTAYPRSRPARTSFTIEATGFQALHQNGIVLEVDQRATLNFTLSIGSRSETVTVEGGAELLNTSDASVSTVIGNRFVENMPLNGRSFSSLIDLAPGVVLTTSNFYEQGQFSVNGQRPDANYFMVDGVSANLGSAGNGSLLAQGGAGQLPATSAFGGTNNLVSLDALEEFRIETSSFAPEYGRTPGAQISVATKSGTNTFHGTAFEYLRNDKLDANDWFANAKGLARPELRQNDFGGVLGGPIRKDKLFFFGSYEGLRVRQPQVANTYEPTVATRQKAAEAVQPLLNAFPLAKRPRPRQRNGRVLGKLL